MMHVYSWGWVGALEGERCVNAAEEGASRGHVTRASAPPPRAFPLPSLLPFR